MGKYYVTGGTQRKGAKGKEEFFSYGEAVIVLVDDSNSDVSTCVTYIPDNNLGPNDQKASIVFKAGSRDGKNLVVCTQTEILIYSTPDFTLIGQVSHPWLNDVHHVMINRKGNFLLANTGLDMVLELSPDGELISHLSVLPEKSVWDRFDKETDYRKVLTTQPHESHPNYVFELNDELWVSRFHQRDLLCLTNTEKKIDIGIERIHDGNVFNGKIYVSTVDGHVIVADPTTCQVLKIHDLNKITNKKMALGWCRSLHVLDDDRVIVGFSRLRPSKFRENVQWAKFKLGKRENAGGLPTRIVLFDFVRNCIEWTIDLEKHNLNAVFSILPAD